jgi:hypothetical protein
MNPSQPKGCFAQEAPVYYAQGLSALPVKPGNKATNISGWTNYCTSLPSKDLQADWVTKFPKHGLAIALGKSLPDGTILGAVDVDDDRLTRLARQIVRPANCYKRGKKGVTIFVRFSGNTKSTQLRLGGKNGTQAADILGIGKMTVLPPTIHPDTGKPYEWTGEELLKVSLESLPLWQEQHIRLFRKLCEMPELVQMMAGESTHQPTLTVCQQMCGFELSDEDITRLVTAILPKDYKGDTLHELPRMIAWAKEHHREDRNGKPRPIVDQLIEWGCSQNLFVDQLSIPYISLNEEIKI